MAKQEDLATVVSDLIEVLRTQARELERLVTHVEQHTGPISGTSEFSVITSTPPPGGSPPLSNRISGPVLGFKIGIRKADRNLRRSIDSRRAADQRMCHRCS